MISTAEAAARIGVSKNTLLRWIAEGRLADVTRDWRNWRGWSEDDVARARALRDQLHLAPEPAEPAEPAAAASATAAVLHEVPYKPVGPGEYAVDLGRLGEGRGFRCDDDSCERKPKATIALYANELDSLGDARRFRAGEEQRHVG